MKLLSRYERVRNGAWMMRPRVLHGGSVQGWGKWESGRCRIEGHWRMRESDNIRQEMVLIVVYREEGS